MPQVTLGVLGKKGGLFSSLCSLEDGGPSKLNIALLPPNGRKGAGRPPAVAGGGMLASGQFVLGSSAKE